MYTIVFVSADGISRQCHCDKYFDASELFDVLTKKYLDVLLYGEPDQHGRVSLLTEYHAN
jgi:hypothetical protein